MSSKRHLRRIKCERKIRYRTAKQAMSANRRFVDMGGDWLNVFPCSHCSGFHLGHRPARVERAKAISESESRIKRQIGAKA
jgi:TnpA family transposase